jgi:Sec-independent protein translocase protein TatA
MDILGIGPLELFFIIIIALIIFGPNDIVKATRTMGKFLRNVVTSDSWRAFQQASKGMKDLPTTLMREAGLEDEDLRELTGIKDLEEATKGFENQISPWTTPPSKIPEQPTNPASSWLPEESPPGETQTEIELEPETPSEEPVSPPPGSPFSQNIDE